MSKAPAEVAPVETPPVEAPVAPEPTVGVPLGKASVEQLKAAAFDADMQIKRAEGAYRAILGELQKRAEDTE